MIGRPLGFVSRPPLVRAGAYAVPMQVSPSLNHHVVAMTANRYAHLAPRKCLPTIRMQFAVPVYRNIDAMLSQASSLEPLSKLLAI